MLAEILINIGRGLLGLVVMVGVCWFFSLNRKGIDWKLVFWGISFQIILGLLMLKVPGASAVVNALSSGFVKILDFTGVGGDFLFSPLTDTSKFGFILAIKVLPVIVFVSALSSVLYYFGILQKFVFAFAWLLQRTMRISGSESLAAAANIFLGPTEAALIIRPYVQKMTRSELLCLMVGGLASIAASVFGIYVGFLGAADPARQVEFASHLLTASVLSAPAAVVCSKILLPQTETIDPSLELPSEQQAVNAFDALMLGTSDGVKLAINVGAALLVFIALVALINFSLESFIGAPTGLNGFIAESTGGAYNGLTLQWIFSILFAPVAWIIGISGDALPPVGQLLGERLVINEFVAYKSLADMIAAGRVDHRTAVITAYALCGFSNFSSIGILIGGISVIAPGQRENLARLALRSLLGGTIASLMTACVACMIV